MRFSRATVKEGKKEGQVSPPGKDNFSAKFSDTIR
jgi:hypothetical protein